MCLRQARRQIACRLIQAGSVQAGSRLARVSGLRLLLWTLPLLMLPPIGFATGVYLSGQQPPCPGGFIDGPCDPGYEAFGVGFWLFWLSAFACAVEIAALVALGVWRYVKR